MMNDNESSIKEYKSGILMEQVISDSIMNSNSKYCNEESNLPEVSENYISNMGCRNSGMELPSIASTETFESKQFNTKRGPGRPRKDISTDLCKVSSKGIQKRKFSKEGYDESCLQISSADGNSYIGNEKTYIDEPFYLFEKFPGKVCCFCNLNERSSLGQGDLLRIDDEKKDISLLNFENDKSNILQYDDAYDCTNRRPRNCNKYKPTSSNDCLNELDLVGYTDVQELISIYDGEYLYLHRRCALWSLGGIDQCNMGNILQTLHKNLNTKCFFCGKYGASIRCRMKCEKHFHFPCASASGSFLIFQIYNVFCSDHLHNVVSVCKNISIECRYCSLLGDISKLIMCSTCGNHFHTTCIGLVNLPDTRAGWNCQQCNKCQICRKTEYSEGRSIKCEQCQKLYHTSCLRPIIASIPKYGWKCNRCRICSDCGSRTPGAGASSRWHSHYTICDSCYQQRNKGFFCPICRKAYRTTAHKEMVKCNSCNRFVHSSCDNDADLSVYHKKKDNNPDYDYFCPGCKVSSKTGRQDALNIPSIVSSESSYKDTESDYSEKFSFENSLMETFNWDARISKKRLMSKDYQRSRFGKSNRGVVMSQFGKKRTSRGKNRQIYTFNTTNSAGVPNTRIIDDDINIEKKIILCSSKDSFVLNQDICAMCGSIGINEESYLISCAQCGQCYHSYCASVKISEVILKRGWRCLDCTVCEGCGQKNDEARLILCDECDISYHIYCMYPPLDTVPHGNWKCNWCAVCQKCGQHTTSKNSTWRNGFLECGLCASQTICYVCMKQYTDNDLIIKCGICERWLHGYCNLLNIKTDEFFANNDYICSHCRSIEQRTCKVTGTTNNVRKRLNILNVAKCNNFNSDHIIRNQLLKLKSEIYNDENTYVRMVNNNFLDSTHNNICNKNNNSKAKLNDKSGSNIEPFITKNDAQANVETTHWVDGIYVSELGLQLIKSQTAEIKKKRNSRFFQDSNSKESTYKTAQKQSENLDNANNITDQTDGYLYKDGMIWFETDKNPPDGFSIFVNDEGLKVLRKKRQRNMQKVGVGGFLARNRFIKTNIESRVKIKSTNSVEKEKKNFARKKLKPKLNETYPIYLQEAFFGKSLLSLKEKNVTFYESETTDDISFIRNKTNKNRNNNAEFDVTQNIILEEQTNEIRDAFTSTNFATIDKKELFYKENYDTDNKLKLEIEAQLNAKSAEDEKSDHTHSNKSNKIPSSDANVSNMLTENDINGEIFVDSTSVGQKRKSEQNFNTISACYKKNYQNYASREKNHKLELHNSKMSDERINEVNKFHSLNSKSSTKNKLEKDSSITALLTMEECIRDENKSPFLATDSTLQNNSKIFEHENIVLSTISTEVSGAGTQKTAEKMRHDEGLGKLATISAVLYANTQYPELKVDYPNWNDRCKQILKKWRSLPTEKKSPFLQLARDNRSALRIRRSQQDNEKLNVRINNSKEEEQEDKKHKSTSSKNACQFERSGDELRIPNKSFQRTFPLSTYPGEVRSLLNVNRIAKSSIGVCNNQFGTLVNNFDGHRYQLENVEATEIRMLNIVKKQHEEKDIILNWSAKPRYQRDQAEMIIKKQTIKGRQEMKFNEKTENSEIETDENVGLGDIFGGFSETDDDDIIKSLTSEIGHDFNILEYADPDLDEITAHQSILSKFDFEDN